MSTKPEIVTAAQLDAMTPDERRAEFERCVVRNGDELPQEMRDRIRATSEQLARSRRNQ